MAERFKEVDNVWLNTGGHCMVDITSVYDSQEKRILYMMVGMDWMTLSTYNYVQLEVPEGTAPEDYIVYSIELNDFTTDPAPLNDAMHNMPDGYFELFDHGLLSYIKNNFKHDHHLTRCPADALPVKLRNMVTDEYAAWLSDNSQLVTTDGDKIIVDDRFKVPELDSNGKAAVAFKLLLEDMRDNSDIDEVQLEKFYAEQIHLIINGKVFTLDMCASVWNGLIEYADYIIDEQ